jgi:hypothetical protein
MEGYRHEIENNIKTLEQKYYPAVNPIDGKPTTYSPVCREVRLFDVVFQEEIKDMVLRDLGFYEKEKRHKIKYLDWLFKLFKPNGWFNPERKKGYERRELPLDGHILVLAEKKDLKKDSGYEVV